MPNKMKKTRRQTTVFKKTKRKTAQNEPYQKPGWSQVLEKGKQTLIHMGTRFVDNASSNLNLVYSIVGS